jgi:ketosteroid isomerase-like protein
MRQWQTFGFLVVAIAATAGARTAAASDAATQPALAVVERFERALADGDRTAALAQLAPDLRVFESGHVENSRDDYAASHLDADIEYLKTVRTTLKSRNATATADSALVLSETEVRNERDGKSTTRAGLETIALRRTREGWRITHIHWSSREIKQP